MAIKWSYFFAAVAIGWFFLFLNGAPVHAVVLGTAAVAAWNFWQQRREAAMRKLSR